MFFLEAFLRIQQVSRTHDTHVLPVLVSMAFFAVSILFFVTKASPQFDFIWLFLGICPLIGFATAAYLGLTKPKQSWGFHISIGIGVGLLVNYFIGLFFNSTVPPSVANYVLFTLSVGSFLGGGLVRAAHTIMCHIPQPNFSLLRSKHVWEHTLLPLIAGLVTHLLTSGH